MLVLSYVAILIFGGHVMGQMIENITRRWAFEVSILEESLTRTLSVLIDGRVDKLIDWLFEVVI